jgi:hypothetical protein
MAKFKPGQTIRFTYNPKRVDEDTGDRFKEVFVLNPSWQGKMHGIDLKRLTQAEREVVQAVFDPKTKKRMHRIPLVNDVLRRMDPLEEVKNPLSFYHKFVKVFLRNKDAYRTYELPRMLNATVAKQSNVLGGVSNPKPLFHKVETKSAPDKAKLDLIRRVAAEKGVGVSPKVGGGVFKKI